MALQHTEIRKGTYIVFNGDPHQVLEHSMVFKGRGSSVMQTRLRNLRTGNVLSKTFHAGETPEEADIEKFQARFIFERSGAYTFTEEGNPKNRFTLSKDQIGQTVAFLVPNTAIEGIRHKDNVIGITLPVKMTFRVSEAPPGVKGDRAQGGTKNATLETGAVIAVPLFVETGDLIEINTETGEYARRVQG